MRALVTSVKLISYKSVVSKDSMTPTSTVESFILDILVTFDANKKQSKTPVPAGNILNSYCC